jgi:sulfite exporter TauE/SafE/copper chaperone CopZ
MKHQPVTDSAAGRSRATVAVAIEGMHCRSCELTVERKFMAVAGVGGVRVSAASGVARIRCTDCTPDLAALRAAVAPDGYHVRSFVDDVAAASPLTIGERPTFWQLAGAFAVVLVIVKLSSRFGLLQFSGGLSEATTFGAVFLLGLVAASSSCLAVAGGLMLASLEQLNLRLADAPRAARLRPVLLFVGGRLAGYFLFGGLIGLLGVALSPPPLVIGALTVAAALYMLTMGLDMLRLAPRWLKRFMPHAPKRLAHRILDAEGATHPLAVALLGAATFFLPCGFTQALQLYALTTGSFWTSATLLLAFALGTAPALLALGVASGSLRGRAGRLFFRFAGAFVVVLGLWNLQNGFTVAGYPLPTVTLAFAGEAAGDSGIATFDGRQQTVRMSVSTAGYTPARLTVRQNIPTRWEIDTQFDGGCLSVIQSPRLGIQRRLQPGLNVIEFTPRQAGTFAFSCSMGMFWGQIDVVPNVS